MILPGETEAGTAGMQPCRGIAWRAHRDDDRSAEVSLSRSSKNHIGSVDPDALKIPARRAECSLTENARSPFHAEPGRYKQWLFYVMLDPSLATTPNLLPEVRKRFEAMMPFVEFLNGPLVQARRKDAGLFFRV